jgi:hypothetical protein
MPKSIAIPMKSGAKAIETGLKGPITATAKAAQPASPTISVNRIAAIVRIDRMPTTSQKQIRPRQRTVERVALSERAASWSLFRATGPVTLTVTPFPGVRPASRARP